MDLLSIVLAVVQGLFEWLPISSSGLLTLISYLGGISICEGYEFGLSLHLASGFAALIVFRRLFLEVAKSILSFKFNQYSKGYVLSIGSSLIIGAPLYLFFTSILESLSSLAGSIALLVIGAGLLVTTYMIRGGGGVEGNISARDWIVVGALQGLAVLPGFSRSGLTIGYMCMRKYLPEKAVETSLLIAIPVLISVGAYSSYELIVKGFINPFDLLVLDAIVLGVSMGVAELLVKFARRAKLHYFTLAIAVLTVIGGLLQMIGLLLSN